MKNKSKKGKHTARKHRVRDDEDFQNQKEVTATKASIAAEEKAKAAAADYKKRWNQFDGSFHNDDGSQILPDGTPVNGVNKFATTNRYKKDDVEDQQ